MAKKLTTAEILAAARAQDAGGDAPAPSPAKSAPEPAETADAAGSEVAEASGEPAETETAAAPPAGKPKSTQDILARLRAEAKGGGAKESPKAKPAAKPAPAKKTAAAKTPAATGDKPSPLEMLKAMREAKQAESADAEKAAESSAEPKKPARGKPAAKRKASAPADVSRRNVVAAIAMAPLALIATPFAAAWTFLTTATAAFSLALARFMMPNVLVEPPSKFKVGSPSDYPGGTVSTKWKAEYGVWIIHTEYEGKNLIYALFSICTHLGCTPNWLEGEQKFKCPCHGSGFYINGINFEGPAPRPLERTAISIAPDGMLEVDKSLKFQQELGQWEDTKSYIELA